MKTLQEIQLNDSFSVSLGLDDSNIEEVAEYLLEMDVVDVIDNNYVEDVSIVRSVLKQHHLLHNDSNLNDDDFGEHLTLVTNEKSNRAITNLIKFFSIESSLSTKLQSKLLCNLQKACRPLIHLQKIEKLRLLKQSTIRLLTILQDLIVFELNFIEPKLDDELVFFLNSVNC